MASPLELFRKKQKVLMVPLTILAMFAFIVMDQLKPEQVPPIVGMLVFGGLFWYLGKDRGKGTLFAAIGTVIGFFIGFAYIPRPGSAMVVRSTAGNIDQAEFQKLRLNRNMANQFVVQTYYASLTEEERERAREPYGAMFGFGRRNREDDLILEFLFRKEADKMNLIVSDDAISQYISRYTNDKLSREAFKETCQKMGVTEGQIYDILRDQLKARLVFQLRMPEISLTPDQYWNFYKKLNVREELELVALPVKDFESEVPALTENQKKAFFESYKAVFPNEKGPGTPGLRQPQKVMTEYLMVDYEEAEKLVAPVTDAEIKEFYEANKERLYKNNPIPDMPDMNPTEDQPVEAVKPEQSAPKAAGSPKAPSQKTKPEAAPKKATEKKATEKKTTEKKPAEKKPAEKKKTPEKKEESSALDSDTTTFVTLLDEKSTDKKSIEKKTTPEKTANEKPAAKKSADKKPSTNKPAENKPVVEKPTNTPTDTPKPDSAAPNSKKGTTTAPPPLAAYRALDDDLKSEIRDQLLRERSLALMKKKIRAALIFMDNINERVYDDTEGATPPTPEEITAQLKAYAAKHQLIYNITPLMSQRELVESEKYPLGAAKEPTLNQFAAQSRTVIDQLFNTPLTLLYTAYEAEDPFSSALIAYWKVKHIDAMIPKYNDPGIAQLITEQMKLEGARPIAGKRAEELKKLIVDAGDQEMQTALKGQTITGKKGGEEISTQTTEAFSWMRTPTAGASNPFSRPRPEISTISSIDGAGNDFMEQIFDNMENGDVGVVTNADKSVYYVVKVINRIPSTEGGRTAMYQEFLKTDLFFFFSPYLPMAQDEHQQTIYEWSQEIEKKYEVEKYFEQVYASEESPESSPQ